MKPFSFLRTTNLHIADDSHSKGVNRVNHCGVFRLVVEDSLVDDYRVRLRVAIIYYLGLVAGLEGRMVGGSDLPCLFSSIGPDLISL